MMNGSQVLWGMVRIGALIVVLLAAAACTPAAEPKPTVVPSAASQSTTQPAWKAEWDKVVAAAKKEGKVVVAGRPGDAARRGVVGFEKAYPEIRLEWTGVEGNDFGAKTIPEQKAGLYQWDVYVGGAGTLVRVTVPAGVHDPLKPAFILPEVLDDGGWRGGLDNWWQDAERQYVFGFEAGKQGTLWVNRDFVPQAELSTLDQLLDPKWKGKIISGDLSVAGAPGAIGAWLVRTKGEDWFRKFVGQAHMVKDERSVVEAAIRGTHPIMVGLSAPAIASFYQEGLMKNFEVLEPTAQAANFLTTGANNIALVTKAPNPNAAKVFVNWFLSREGQQSYADATGVTSSRVDVSADVPELRQLKPGVEYLVALSLEMVDYQARSYAIAKEVMSR